MGHPCDCSYRHLYDASPVATTKYTIHNRLTCLDGAIVSHGFLVLSSPIRLEVLDETDDLLRLLGVIP